MINNPILAFISKHAAGIVLVLLAFGFFAWYLLQMVAEWKKHGKKGGR